MTFWDYLAAHPTGGACVLIGAFVVALVFCVAHGEQRSSGDRER